MASFRAIEQGCNLFRQASLGLSAAFDCQGRRLAAMDHFLTADRTLVAQVPTAGVHTLHSRLGDWGAWGGAALLAVLVLLAFRRRG